VRFDLGPRLLFLEQWMEIRLASVPHYLVTVVTYFQDPWRLHTPSTEMDVNISRERRGLVLIAVYRLEVPCIYKEYKSYQTIRFAK